MYKDGVKYKITTYNDRSLTVLYNILGVYTYNAANDCFRYKPDEWSQYDLPSYFEGMREPEEIKEGEDNVQLWNNGS